MKSDDIEEIIGKIPSSKPYDSKSQEYKDDLKNRLLNLSLIDNHLKEKVEKLLIGENTSDLKSLFTYNQGISELLWWFFLDKKKISFKIEQKMVHDKDTNIDVQYELNGITYNVEIKSPEYPIKKEGNLQGRISCRVPNVDMKGGLSEITDEFKKILNNSEYNDVEEVYPTENKIKDCLLSAQNKFIVNSSTNCNVLFIATTTEELSHYINYFVNPYSGFFTPKSFIPHYKFDNVKAVILSNSISMNSEEIEKGWDLDNSLNLIFYNPFCKYKDNLALKRLMKFILNKTCEYEKELKSFMHEQNKLKPDKRLPIELFFTEFVNKYSNK